ncbi:NlpC/P60 family protein [Burkholderia gladioli]|uniref:NlpC/P60 family protein n=1 Tax=Burkholderia gladioli TaxID=28095 RepID=UPI00163E7D4F|nr:NlpC/P60 family protein [Burkholderia gladioli]
MNAADANRYINLPWESGAVGPDAFDCWGLLRWVQLHHFGIRLPALPALVEDRRLLYLDEVNAGRWQPCTAPFHGCGVLLRGGDRPHVGVWLDLDAGGVLHAQEGAGVIFTERSNMKRMGYPRATYFRFL